jgi:isopentenyldiphosphate isomerase
MSFLDRIRECNAHDLTTFLPFIVDGTRLGWVRPAFAQRLAAHPGTFAVSDAVTLDPRLNSFAARSAAVNEVLRHLAEDGLVKGWRAEYYPVTTSFGAPPLLQMERAAVPQFGVRAYGVHMNGYVRRRDGIHMWIGRRAYDKHTYPGMLDNTVAGGQPIGIGLRENLIKECQEEASIPESLARQAVPVGCITYCVEAPDGLKPDVQYCYDLELPADFVPKNTDGEIAEFHLWPIAKVAEIVAETQEFKFNCNLVIIDFLIRHGFIAPDHPDYIALCQGLRK